MAEEKMKRRPRGPTDRSGAQTYTVGEFAKLLGISRQQGYTAAARGEIPTIRLGCRIVVPKIAGDKMLAGEG